MHSGQFLFAAVVSGVFVLVALFMGAYGLAVTGVAFGAAGYGLWRLDRRFRR